MKKKLIFLTLVSAFSLQPSALLAQGSQIGRAHV